MRATRRIERVPTCGRQVEAGFLKAGAPGNLAAQRVPAMADAMNGGYCAVMRTFLSR